MKTIGHLEAKSEDFVREYAAPDEALAVGIAKYDAIDGVEMVDIAYPRFGDRRCLGGLDGGGDTLAGARVGRQDIVARGGVRQAAGFRLERTIGLQ